MANFDIDLALSLEGHTWPERAMSSDPKSNIMPGRPLNVRATTEESQASIDQWDRLYARRYTAGTKSRNAVNRPKGTVRPLSMQLHQTGH